VVLVQRKKPLCGGEGNRNLLTNIASVHRQALEHAPPFNAVPMGFEPT
jgi:hypothetical protein